MKDSVFNFPLQDGSLNLYDLKTKKKKTILGASDFLRLNPIEETFSADRLEIQELTENLILNNIQEIYFGETGESKGLETILNRFLCSG